jgi:hypothetical protein
MVADFNKTFLEDFFISQYAQWAGDYPYCIELVSRVAEAVGAEAPRERDLENIRNSNALLQVAAQRRLVQLSRRQREFEAIRISLPLPQNRIGFAPMILETPHLRGAIWRLGVREFGLFAYLKKTSWLKKLLRNAMRVSREANGEVEEAIPEPAPADVEVFEGHAYGWVIPRNPFTQVFVSELGLIEAVAHATGRRPPRSVRSIRSRFDSILQILDPA